MPAAYDRERQGRLMLWGMALDKCRSLLELAARADEERYSDAAKEKEERFRSARKTFAASQSDHIPDQINDAHYSAFKALKKREFGAEVDCVEIQNSRRMLAIVVFCQLFNKGFSAVGRVAENNKFFRDKHLDDIKNKVVKSSDENKRFDELCGLLFVARHKMIGHADGDAFDVSHHPQWTSVALFENALRGIDFDYWRSILEPMSRAVSDLRRESQPDGNR